MSFVPMGVRPVVHMARHLKNGTVFRVLAEGLDTEDLRRKVVVYEQLHDHRHPEHGGVTIPRGTVWIRDKEKFVNEFRQYAVR